MKTTDYAEQLERYFTRYLPNEKGNSPQTIDSYRYAFVLYFEYMESVCGIKPEEMALKDFTSESVLGFLKWLEEFRRNSSATCNYRLVALRGFAHYLEREFPDCMEECRRILHIPLMKKEQKEISYMRAEAIELLVGQIDIESKNGLRDYVIILILYTTGVRVTELIHIKVGDISLEEPYVIRIRDKRHGGRYVPLMKAVVQYVQKYLACMDYDREACKEEFLFKNHLNRPFTRQGINHVLNKYGAKAREKDAALIPMDLSANKIRRTMAMELIASGADLVYIRNLLGHSSVATTEAYCESKYRG